MTWKESVMAAVLRITAKHRTSDFTRQQLINEERDQIVLDTRSEAAKTPKQTLSRTLQELWGAGLIKRIGPGRYMLLKRNVTTEHSTKTSPQDLPAKSDSEPSVAKAAKQLNKDGEFDPEGITDARKRVSSSIARRQGQPAFRKRLMTNYAGRCAISGCDVKPVLEAAHILPYLGPKTNHPSNGLLLRADLHTLFDLRLITVDPQTKTVLIDPKLIGTLYEQFSGKPIRESIGTQPSVEALNNHRKESKL